MQRLKKCLGIDIGMSSIKIAEIVSEKAGARVTKLVRADLDLPPGPMDTERINAVSKAVRDLLKESKISSKHAVFCVPGQSVFIRRIRVPRTTDERLHRIVAYEARQQIPFALDNSLMEYQVFDWDGGPEVEVLLVAIKKDIVTDFMKIVSKTGVKPIMISVSSLALFNFHVFDSTPFDELSAFLNPKKKQKKDSAKVIDLAAAEASNETAPAKKKGLKFSFNFGKKKSAEVLEEPAEAAERPVDLESPEMAMEDVYEEVRAYVNVGAQTFDLAIARLGKHKMLGFTRSVPWAGNELTRSLLDKLHLGSAEEAEEMKRQHAIIIVPGREEEVQTMHADADASEFTTSWADRLILDLRKSFDYYISQPDGMAVDNILLSGGQAKQVNLPGYVEDKLGIPVDLKSSIENAALTIAEGTHGEDLSSFLISIGMGLTGIGLGQVTVDFLPPELKTIREFKKKNIEVALLAAAIAGMLVVSTQIGSRSMENMTTWLRDNESAINSAQQTKAQLQQARADIEAVSGRYTALSEGINDRSFWLEFMGMIESIKPAEVLITAMHMNPDGTVKLDCEAKPVGAISNFADQLRQQKEWIESVNLSSPVPSFSQFIPDEINKFSIQLKVNWKKTRLDGARGPWNATTPTPEPAKAIQYNMPGRPGVPVI
jgi:Tfp pilus assembly PilM family ATPase